MRQYSTTMQDNKSTPKMSKTSRAGGFTRQPTDTRDTGDDTIITRHW